ncbi:endonuclease/exonuclease/phosphatase family protein [Enterococcus columbae]|uniref:Endonuclease/exonuclease/phosphatase domain-containing protein n=1 Tax=Enterococcus columbae DSM 7374 = ATCC 51263 TaxID=1121865 RepID=S1NUG9_9ENTE|nr:endonuclease/exonuclease/phosphatase family protein [Enterococcus columbae]EOT44386.1 hypothetical protein OMW_00442 [Enterococcus columbae DSM 7374 = ATCC 51263]EOW84544.1 hypothetical protein I568_01040 [Enterococcus columbae DSM 7374 = ATCC 51263]
MKKIHYIFSFMILCAIFIVIVLPMIPFFRMSPFAFLLIAFRSTIFLVLAFIFLLIQIIFAIFAHKTRIHADKKGILSTVIIMSLLLGGTWYYSAGNQVYDLHQVPAKKSGQIRILSWNTNHAIEKDELLSVVKELKPDIVFFPEEWQGQNTKVFDCDLDVPEDQKPTHCYLDSLIDSYEYFKEESPLQTLLVPKKYGLYSVESGEPYYAGFFATPPANHSESPYILLAHIQRPEFGIGTSWWQKHMEWAKEKSIYENMIAAGDFNATLGNIGGHQLGELEDMAYALNQNQAGTWPTFLPAFLGAPIDHIFIGKAYKPIWFGVLNTSKKSDHRAIFGIVEKVNR